MPYTVEMGNRICEEIALGKSLRAICKPEGMPAASTVCLWLTENPKFAEQYTRAREAQADYLAEETIEIADDSRQDYIQTENGPVFNSEHVNRSRLRVDARKWFASKVAPKKYGDKAPGGEAGGVTIIIAR